MKRSPLAGSVFRIVGHILMVAASLCAAFALRFEFSLPAAIVPVLVQAVWIAVLVKTPVFYFAGADRGLRQFAGVSDLARIAIGNLAASLLFSGIVWLQIGSPFPRSIYLIDLLICLLLTLFIRFSTRIYRELAPRPSARRKRKRILIYGAGTAGATLLEEIRRNPSLGYEVRGFLDDDPAKRRALVMGVRVLGCGREAAAIVDRLKKRRCRIEEIVIAMPSASGRQMREALANCHATHLRCKTIPGVGELLTGRVLTRQIRNLSLVDLLGRPPVELDTEPIRARITGRSVLVTGAAGSIGSELCRQIAGFAPARLVAFDQSESDLFRIDRQLRETFPALEVFSALGDLRDRNRLSEVFDRFDIASVFHAAAYKHVPMLESHVLEAVQNNVIGTWNLLSEVRRRHVPDFLMISSDKAVNPTSMMGTTKRLCEILVSALPPGSGPRMSKCVSVRFGNVLGSNGSVVPIFQAQIAAGGPVKVTHPEIRRYFMTIPEAVLLVLLASTMGKGSEIFVLDMGEPIRIVDLAINMIRLAGLEPGKDIEIRFTGLRPGEKLYEEIHLPEENMLRTYHDKIRIFRHSVPDWSAVRHWMSRLEALVALRRKPEIVAHIRSLVPEYQLDSDSQPRGGEVTPLVTDSSPRQETARVLS